MRPLREEGGRWAWVLNEQKRGAPGAALEVVEEEEQPQKEAKGGAWCRSR